MPTDSRIFEPSTLRTATALMLRAFDAPFWPWQRLVRWLYFRDVDRLNEGWWHLAEQPMGASSPVQDRHPNATLVQELQTGRLLAFGEGTEIPREAWAGEPSHLRYQVHFRREDVMELWPASTLASQALSIASSPQRAATQLRQASEAQIHRSITAVYNDHDLANRKPPNVREVGPLVRNRLHEHNVTASLRRIEKLAGDSRYKVRRLSSGKRYRARSSEL